jgi:hypothetical protein|tara:strand:- start:354 stop:617 length:264 start_codon:yes stop_codon:yes gene_type:complete
MNFVGKTVYAIWRERHIRFGVVLEEKIENKWKYVRVDWKDDKAFEMDRDRVTALRNMEIDPQFEWYRIDQIKAFNPMQMVLTLGKLL